MAHPSQIKCPHCGSPCVISPEQIGQNIKCPQCGKSAVVESAPKSGNAIAVASRVCGLFIFIPIASLLAIIFGIIGLKKSKDPRAGRKGSAIAGIVLGCLGLVTFFPVEVSIWWQFYHTSQRVRCSSNLTQIGRAILLYANDNRGRYPPDLGTLVKNQDISVDLFLCPSMPGGTSLPSNLAQMTRDQQAQWVNDHTDFIYLGAGLTEWGKPETIVLYAKHDEKTSAPDSAFGPDEVQMLFADGHVEPIYPADARRRIESQKSN